MHSIFPQTNQFLLPLSPLQQLEIPRQGRALFFIQFPRIFVAGQTVHPPPPRENPQQPPVIKILPEAHVQNFNRYRHKLPALLANRVAAAAFSDFVVVRRVDVENYFLFLGYQQVAVFEIAGFGLVNRAHVYADGVLFLDCFGKF